MATFKMEKYARVYHITMFRLHLLFIYNTMHDCVIYILLMTLNDAKAKRLLAAIGFNLVSLTFKFKSV